jgi:hypothetical protein
MGQAMRIEHRAPVVTVMSEAHRSTCGWEPEVGSPAWCRGGVRPSVVETLRAAELRPGAVTPGSRPVHVTDPAQLQTGKSIHWHSRKFHMDTLRCPIVRGDHRMDNVLYAALEVYTPAQFAKKLNAKPQHACHWCRNEYADSK